MQILEVSVRLLLIVTVEAPKMNAPKMRGVSDAILIRKMTSTVKQITLTSPTAPPMIGPRDKDLLLGATTDMMGARSIIATVCEVSPDDVSFECDPVGKVANELVCWAEVLIKDNHSRDCPGTHVQPVNPLNCTVCNSFASLHPVKQ